jgi:hypothetical protein
VGSVLGVRLATRPAASRASSCTPWSLACSGATPRMARVPPVTEFRVGIPRELTADHVAELRSIGIVGDVGPATYAGFNDLSPMVTYVRLQARDEREAREKVGDALGLDPHALASAHAAS